MKLKDLKELGLDEVEVQIDGQKAKGLEVSDDTGFLRVLCNYDVVTEIVSDFRLCTYGVSSTIRGLEKVLIILGIYKKPLISLTKRRGINYLKKIGLINIKDCWGWGDDWIKVIDVNKYIEVDCLVCKPSGIIDKIEIDINYVPVSEKQLKEILKIIDW